MTQKKKIKVKVTEQTPKSINQSNNVEMYSFNPFQPEIKIIQTKSGVIKITPKGRK